MKSKVLIVRQIDYVLFTVQVVLSIWLILALGIRLGVPIYLCYFIYARFILIRKHRKGIKFIKKGLIDEAILIFEESYEFFNKHPFINKYVARFISACKATYKEMALINIAYCLIKKNEASKAKEMYERVLEEFPNSLMATHALETIEAFKNIE